MKLCLLTVSVLPLLVACGGNVDVINLTNTDSGTNDSSTNQDSGADAGADTSVPVEAGPFAPASHPAAPQVESYGGSVMASPKIVPIFFTGDDSMQKQIEQFLAQLPGSGYWSAATGEYGVGQPTIAPTIISSDTPPITDDALQTWLVSMTDGTHKEWPTPDANTLYAVFLPDGVTITIPQWGKSCQGFGGYHSEGTSKQSQSIVYALMPRCASFGQLKGVDALTTTLSHELVEAVTDPADQSNPAYALPDKDHYVWALVPLSEVGDMCTYEPQSNQRLVGNFMVQRTWSNASAKAGHDPCVPLLTDPYFNSVPVLDENVTINFGGQGGQGQTKGVKIPVGTSKTIEVDLFSDAPTTDWTVQAIDMQSYFYGGSPDLTFTWDQQSGNNGDKLHLTITREKKGQYNGSEFIFYSQKGIKIANLWFGFVSN
jgi:hypothetical protein